MSHNPHTSAVARALVWLITAQWEMVWKASREEIGVIPGPETIPKKSHPHIGNKLAEIPPEGQLFVRNLAMARIEHFKEMAREGTFRHLLDIGAGRQELSAEFQEKVAIRFHEDWLKVRSDLNLTGHRGDKDWQDETSDEQLNDLTLVNKWAALWNHCVDGGEDGNDKDLKGLVQFILDEESA